MAPDRDGDANHGHACVKGRFAFGYATHPDRVATPMIRRRITDPWQPVSWDEAVSHAASELRRIQAQHGTDSIGGITSSRCTNEETFLVQKMVRAAFVPTTSTRVHASVIPRRLWVEAHPRRVRWYPGVRFGDEDGCHPADCANPVDAHPVFASRMKQRLRQGARLIIADPAPRIWCARRTLRRRFT